MLATDRDGNEVAKLVDFGIAKTFDDRTQLTATGFAIGTPQYMAPEQASGAEVDGRSDLYSLGVILYEMLVADVPFNAPSTAAILVKHLTEAPIRPSLRRSDVQVHLGLEEVAVRCLEKEPGKRFQNADEMVQAIAEAIPLSKETGVAAVPLAAAVTATHAAPGVPARSTAPGPAPAAPAAVPAVPTAAAAAASLAPQPAAAAAPPAAQPVGIANVPPAAAVKGGRNSLALGVGALAIVALAGMGFALQQFVGGDSESESMLGAPPASDQSQSASQQPSATANPDTKASEPSAPPPASDAAAAPNPAASAAVTTPSTPASAESGTRAGAATEQPADPASKGDAPPPRANVRELAPNAARGARMPSAVATAERGSAPPPAPAAPPPPAAPPLAENPTVLLRCDGATEVCGAVRDAFNAALERENMPLTSSAPRADIYIVVGATAVDGQVQQQFGTTFVTRNYVINVELEAPKMESAPSAPRERTFSADLRVGRERVNENARLAAMDTVQKIRDFWNRQRSAR
jgi:hypothetical protein